jgi:putative membrane protein
MFGCRGLGFGGFYGAPPFMMMIPMIIFLIVAGYFIYKLFINKKNNNNPVSSQSFRAIEILNERFAKGEINEEEYIARKSQLQN